eukprot:scaffold1170_cov158-Ochromonas_danica.AAC.11
MSAAPHFTFRSDVWARQDSNHAGMLRGGIGTPLGHQAVPPQDRQAVNSTCACCSFSFVFFDGWSAAGFRCLKYLKEAG